MPLGNQQSAFNVAQYSPHGCGNYCHESTLQLLNFRLCLPLVKPADQRRFRTALFEQWTEIHGANTGSANNTLHAH
jgi:hypothetical protein